MSAEIKTPAVPTIEEMNLALDRFGKAVDAEDVLAGTVHAAVCTGILERLRDLLQSGAYALISRTDRESAITSAVMCGSNQVSAAIYKNDRSAESARVCLDVAREQLQLPKEPS